jgi:hypothetical protein
MLSGFLLRSLIPVGFMPMAGPGHSVRLVVCDDYAPTPRHAPMSMGSMSHESHGSDALHPGGSRVHQHGGCVYGSGPALGALPSLAMALIVVQPLQELAPASPQVGYFERPSRAQSPRGPPAQT